MRGKRVNTVRKGNRNQNKCAKKLQAEGWQTYTARRGYKGNQIDVFGLFDIIAHRDGYFRFIQVKSNRCPMEVKRKIGEFLTDGVFVKREVWVYKDHSRHNPQIEIITSEF